MNLPLELLVLDTRQVLAVKGRSLPTLWRDIKAGRFPQPLERGTGRGRNLWDAAEVVRWQQDRLVRAKRLRDQEAA